MKTTLTALFAFCVVALAAGKTVPVPYSVMGDKLRAGVEEFRRCMPVGFPHFDIPAISPLFIDSVSAVLKSNSELSSLNITLWDSVVQEHHNFHVNDIDMNLLLFKATFDLSFPHIFMAGKHISKAKVLKIIPINLTGKGEYAVRVNDLHVTGEVNMKIQGKYLVLNEIKLQIKMGSLDSKIRGILGPLSELAFNKIIESVAPGMLDDYQEEINNLIQGLIPVINEQMGEMEMLDFFDLLNNLDQLQLC